MPKIQLSVEDPVLVQDYRKSQDPWVKGVVVAKLGHVTYCVQVKELFWKQHIDQLKDLSGMQIQPHGQEQLEDCEVNVLHLFFADKQKGKGTLCPTTRLNFLVVVFKKTKGLLSL